MKSGSRGREGFRKTSMQDPESCIEDRSQAKLKHPSIDPVRNLGVWIEFTFSMKPHVIKTCKSAFSHLHNIRRIRNYMYMYLGRGSTEKLIH